MKKATKRPTDVFTPTQKGDRVRAAYLYADGHLVVSFERYVRDVDKTIGYYKQVQSIGVSCRFKGRIVFSSYSGVPFLRSALHAGANAITAKMADTVHGSEKTKRAGIAVAYVEAETKFGTMAVHSFPDMLNPDMSVQNDVCEAFDPELDDIHGSRVVDTLLTTEA